MKKKPFTTVHNDVLEALYRTPLKGREFQLILFISRMTHGFNRSRMKMSETKISQKLGVSRGSIRRSFKRLVNLKVIQIHREPSGKRPAIFGINGDPETWLVDHNGDPTDDPSGSPKDDQLGSPSGSPKGDHLERSSGSAKGDQLGKALDDHPGRSSDDQLVAHESDHPGGPQRGSHGDHLEACGKVTPGLATTGPEPVEEKSAKDISLKENLFKENITKTVQPLAGVSDLKIRSGENPDPDIDPGTHFEPEPSWWNMDRYRGARVVYAYRLLYGETETPTSRSLKFIAAKLDEMLPGVKGPRKKRDLEAALILASRELRHAMALGQEVKNPLAYVFTMLQDHLPAAKEFTQRIEIGFNPDVPASYIWDAEHATLRANKRRAAFERWKLANEEANEKRRRVG